MASDDNSAELRAELLASQSGRLLAASQLRQSEAERVYLRDELDRAEYTLAEHSALHSQLHGEVESLKNENASLRHDLETERTIRASLESSRSWRWTRPLRELLTPNKRRS